ncbi:hypothetical protein [Dyadobacter sandarakinus]|uniref:Outer membrane protein beta-barrel domain-containing protein n=1 Tax=Dyadobacter sandarakinus TaxID=2747268 RepID=A0ABX7I2Q1_9BACT|nr:hypothetical protein [Dyadobacter sandarakinus]QRQ99826.1 hypothetical protein HWI92_02285 [Dyadobacter sandarakinus]
MKKKNVNIDKYSHDPLPEPEIPADEAWTQMSGMLAAGIAPAAGSKLIAKLLKYKFALSGISAVTVVAAIVFIKTTLPAGSGKDLKARNSTALTVIDQNKKAEPAVHAAPFVQIKKADSTENGAGPKVGYRNIPHTSAPDQAGDRAENTSFKPQAGVEQPAALSASKSNRPDPDAKLHSREVLQKVILPDDMQRSNNLGTGFLASGKEAHKKRSDGAAAKAESRNRSAGDVPGSPLWSGSDKGTKTDNSIQVRPMKPIFLTTIPIRKVQPDTRIQIPQQHARAEAAGKVSSIQFGPEWSINSSLNRTEYLFAGKDSVSKPAWVLVPGIFVSRNWKQHAVSFTFSPHQTYFGNSTLLVHTVDPITIHDSLKTYNNVRLKKATGLNFSMYYHYQTTRIFAVGGGVAYNHFLHALVRKEIENYEGKVYPGALATITRPAGLSQHMRPGLLSLKAGILFNPGRFQAGVNVILPVTGVSRIQPFSLKPLNGQFFLRLNVF